MGNTQLLLVSSELRLLLLRGLRKQSICARDFGSRLGADYFETITITITLRQLQLQLQLQ